MFCTRCVFRILCSSPLCAACAFVGRAREEQLAGNDSARLPRHFGRKDHKQEVSMVAAAVPLPDGSGEQRGVIQGELSTASREDVWRQVGRLRGGSGGG